MLHLKMAAFCSATARLKKTDMSAFISYHCV